MAEYAAVSKFVELGRTLGAVERLICKITILDLTLGFKLSSVRVYALLERRRVGRTY